jgi:hypothetical protein
MEGTKINWDHSTVMRELGETTPMSTLIPAQDNAMAAKIKI